MKELLDIFRFFSFLQRYRKFVIITSFFFFVKRQQSDLLAIFSSLYSFFIPKHQHLAFPEFFCRCSHLSKLLITLPNKRLSNLFFMFFGLQLIVVCTTISGRSNQTHCCYRCNISSKASAVLPRRNDTEMGPANSLHASA